jgi:hypothetical protein
MKASPSDNNAGKYLSPKTKHTRSERKERHAMLVLTCPQVPCVTQNGSKKLDLRKWSETWCRSQLLTLKGVEGSCWKLRD